MNEPNVIYQLGAGAFFALLVIREVLNFLKHKKDSKNCTGDLTNQDITKKLEALQKSVDDMKQQSLEGAIDGLRESVDAQTEMFSQFALVQERMLAFLERLEGMSIGRRRSDSIPDGGA